MSSQLSKVTAGDPFRMSADTFNAFVDAAQAHRDRQTSQEGEVQAYGARSGMVTVRNISGINQDRFAVMGIAGFITSPTVNLLAFQNRPAFDVIVPVYGHSGRFVVLAEPIVAGRLGRAHISGVCPVMIDIPDEDHEYRYAEFAADQTGYLKATHYGSARILWREEGIGLRWAVVRLGHTGQLAAFPVKLTQNGGSQGDDQNPATWTYDIVDVLTDETLENAVDPVADPHQWKRPSVGWMIPATFGYAHYNTDNELILGWINEVAEQQACDT